MENLLNRKGCTKNHTKNHTKNTTDEETIKIITQCLISCGIPASLSGYDYLRTAITLVVNDSDIVREMVKRLYPTVAEIHGTTAIRVERGIRHAVEVAWDRGDIDTLNSYFGCTVSKNRGKTTNSEFIAMIADRIRLGLMF